MATKRPTYSSWSTTVRLIGLATVTVGGGGVVCAGCWRCPQPASSRIINAHATQAWLGIGCLICGGLPRGPEIDGTKAVCMNVVVIRQITTQVRSRHRRDPSY